MDKLNKVREKVIEAVPEIVELKFGCRVKVIDKKTQYRYWEATLISPCMGFGYWHCRTHSSIQEKNEIIKAFKIEYNPDAIILGRKIGLADVLITVQDRVEEVDVEEYQCNSPRELWLMWSEKVLAAWCFENDDLQKQSEATISFLYDLLV